MAILFPLCLVGLGACVYYLFAAATLALPILVGAAVGMASHAVGFTAPLSILRGLAAFMLAIALGHFAALSLRSAISRGVLILLFALPAAWTGFCVTHAMASLAGLSTSAIPLALFGALLCATTQANQLGNTRS